MEIRWWEEHIPGIPGDVFIARMLDNPETNKTRLAKEFVKFNERCFVRLLGDMRSYNFVVDITPDRKGTSIASGLLILTRNVMKEEKTFTCPSFSKKIMHWCK
ncbi:MAG: hypothetical protein WDO19_28415 [Bacteroidota bacterium]